MVPSANIISIASQFLSSEFIDCLDMNPLLADSLDDYSLDQIPTTNEFVSTSRKELGILSENLKFSSQGESENDRVSGGSRNPLDMDSSFHNFNEELSLSTDHQEQEHPANQEEQQQQHHHLSSLSSHENGWVNQEWDKEGRKVDLEFQMGLLNEKGSF